MRITSVKIQNFRSLEDVKLDVAKVNILVGQNNHGKTNFLTALDWFYNGGPIDAHQRKDCTDPPAVQVTFDDVAGALDKMKNEKNKTTLSKKLGESDKVTLIRVLDEKGKSTRCILDDDGKLVDPGTGFDKALNDFLPNLEFVQTENNLREALKYGKTTQIGTMLSGVLNEILASGDQKYKDFVDQFYELFGSKESKIYEELRKLADSVQKYIQKQFPETTDVEFEVKSPELTDLFKNFSAKVDDGVVTEAYEKGDGMQRALMLAIIQTFADYRRNNADIKNFVFLIDEGELHLHPGAQRHLKRALEDLSYNGDQIFLTTHSSVLITDGTDRSNQTIFKVEKFDDGVTQIDPQDDFSRQNIIYDLLGGSPSDLLLPSNFIIVEGQSEVEFLSRVISRHYPEMKNLKILPAKGNLNETVQLVNALDKIFTPLVSSIYDSNFRVVIDASKISQQQFNNLLASMPTFNRAEQLFELPVASLEEYYPTKQTGQCDDPSDDRTYMDTWTFSPEDVARMKGRQKISIAKRVGEAITKDQFENEMSQFFITLTSAKENELG